MESLAQLLSSLKENEKSVLVTIIANAFTIYMLCFVGIDEFKTYIWYQQLIIPCALSIVYTTAFYFLFISILGIFFLFKRSRGFCSFMMEDNYKWFLCIFSLANFTTLFEIASTLINSCHEFSLKNILIGTAFALSGFFLLLICIALFSKKDTSKS